MNSPVLCIGTVQFGKNYGITNKNGKINFVDAKAIFSKMLEKDLKFIDTAQSYGDSEKIIGETLLNKNNFKIISKINPEFIYDKNIKSLKKYWDKIFDKTLFNLKIKKLEGLLLHSPRGLTKYQKLTLQEWLYEKKQENKVNKVGISIYEKSDLNEFNLSLIDIIQLPLSIYDQRMINNGCIEFLNSRGIEIYVRSIFLQGLILNGTSAWPKWVSKKDLNNHKKFLYFLKNENISPLIASLAYVKFSLHINKIVVGISSFDEFNQILENYDLITNSNQFKQIFQSIPIFGENILDPRNWPK